MMRKQKGVVHAILCGLLLISCNASNHSADKSENRQDTVASGDTVRESIPLADPYILYHEDTYYAYGTSSDEGFEVYYSDNLLEWNKHPEMLLKREDSFGEKWFWAPEVYYNAINKRFYLFYSAEEHICVATSDSPLGPFRQETKEPMRTEKAIDSSLFIDDKGTPYIYFVRFTNGNVIWVAELEDDWVTIKEETLTMCLETSDSGWETSLGKVNEGASVIKRDDVYYMLYSANDFRSQDYGVGYAIATSPLGPWKKSAENPILQTPTNGLVGTGHGAYFEDKDGKGKYVFHAHHDVQKVSPRLMHIVDMTIGDHIVTVEENAIISPQATKTVDHDKS